MKWIWLPSVFHVFAKVQFAYCAVDDEVEVVENNEVEQYEQDEQEVKLNKEPWTFSHWKSNRSNETLFLLFELNVLFVFGTKRVWNLIADWIHNVSRKLIKTAQSGQNEIDGRLNITIWNDQSLDVHELFK